MDIITTSPLLAQVGQEAASTFLDSDAGQWIGGLLSIAGLLLILVVIFKAGGSVLKGGIGKAVMMVIGAVAFVAILFQPTIMIDLIAWFGTLLQTMLTSVRESL